MRPRRRRALAGIRPIGVGRIVNPLTLHGQAIGGMVQGLGGAFLEDLVYDAKGQLLAGNLADYLIPTARRRRSTEKRAQDARASDGAPIGASRANVGALPTFTVG